MAAAYMLDPGNAEEVEVDKDAEGTVQYIGKPSISPLTAQERVDAVDFLAKQAGRLRLSAAAARLEFEHIGEEQSLNTLVKNKTKAVWLSILVHCEALMMHQSTEAFGKVK
jgi:hypothetical protein